MKSLRSLQEKKKKPKSGQYRAASDLRFQMSQTESILDSQKSEESLTSRAEATLTAKTKLANVAFRGSSGSTWSGSSPG